MICVRYGGDLDEGSDPDYRFAECSMTSITCRDLSSHTSLLRSLPIPYRQKTLKRGFMLAENKCQEVGVGNVGLLLLTEIRRQSSVPKPGLVGNREIRL